MKLNASEINTTLWRRLKEHMERARAELRERNDSITLDERKTCELRGRIAQLTELIAMGDPSPE